jgi:uncharacterized protein YbjT (DUF2867 family)
VRRLASTSEVVRVGTRWPERARGLFGALVEVAELDYDATETYDAATEWVDRLFLSPPPFDPDAFDTVAAFLDWAVDAGVERVVLLSGMGTEQLPDLPLQRLERHIQELDVDYTLLRPNLYMQNFSDGFMGDAIRELGVIELCAGEGRVSFVDVRDVAAVAAAALTGPGQRRSLTLTGSEALSFGEAANVLAHAAGHPIRYQAVDAERMRALLHAWHWADRQAETAVRMFGSVAAGRREPVSHDVEDSLGRPPISFNTFAHEAAEMLR